MEVEDSDALNDVTLSFFEDALSSLFQDSLFAHGNPGELIEFVRQSTDLPRASPSISKLVVRLPVVPDQSVGLMSHYVWNSALVVASLIDDGTIQVQGKRVLELAAGSGLPSVIACLQDRPLSVIVSDYPDDAIMKNLEYNLNRNLTIDRHDLYAVVPHAWGDSCHSLLTARAEEETQFDLILIADALWLRDLHGKLLQSLKTLLKPGQGKIVMAAGIHTGMQCVKDFFVDASAFGFQSTLVRSVRAHGDAILRGEGGSVQDLAENPLLWSRSDELDPRRKKQTVLIHEMSLPL